MQAKYAIVNEHNKITEYPIEDIRKRFWNTSFPDFITPADLPEGVVIVYPTEPRALNLDEIIVGEGDPVLELGNWVQTWVIRQATAQEFKKKKKQMMKKYADLVQDILDTEAQTHDYDSILSVTSYAVSNHSRYGREGKAALQWREDVWDKTYEILNQVLAGERPIPTPEEVLAELPKMVWPNG